MSVTFHNCTFDEEVKSPTESPRANAQRIESLDRMIEAERRERLDGIAEIRLGLEGVRRAMHSLRRVG